MRPAWLDILDREMGVAEVAGPAANPRIMEYFRVCGGDWVRDDATPWCGAALGWAIRAAGYPLPSEPLRARGWCEWGTPTVLVEGAIVVLSAAERGPEAGHVGLLVAHRDGRVYLLGGNQGDQVSIASFDERRVIATRWPPGAPATVEDVATAERLREPPASTRPVSSAGGVPAALAGSKTILGALTALLGTVIQYFDKAVELVLAGAAEMARLDPAVWQLGQIGLDTRSLGAGLAVFGISLALLRRMQAAATGKEG